MAIVFSFHDKKQKTTKCGGMNSKFIFLRNCIFFSLYAAKPYIAIHYLYQELIQIDCFK